MRKLIASLGLLALLTACSTAPGPAAFRGPVMLGRQSVNQQATVRKQPVARSVPLFPAQQGWRWDYAVTLAPVNDPEVPEKGSYSLSVDRVQETPVGTRIELRAVSGFSGHTSFPTLVQSAQGVRLEDMSFLGIGADEVNGLNLDFMRLPLQANARWEDDNWIGKVKGQETVTVPAGTYQAWRVEVIGTLDSAYTAVGDYWIAPGVGMVKSRLTVPGFHTESVLTHAGLAR